MVERVKTGIPGLDEILKGGVPRRNVILLAGGPGTGKTIMGQQFLYYGLKIGEPGIYVALEEHPVQVRINMQQFDWDVKEYEEQGKFAIIDAFTAGIGEAAKREKYVVPSPDDFPTLTDLIRQAIRDINAKRVVVDSVTTLYITKPAVARNIVLQLKKILSG
ncbi:MAG: ATPase domain-containing protein, partial [Candidatus Methanomethylicia archaeon]